MTARRGSTPIFSPRNILALLRSPALNLSGESLTINDDALNGCSMKSFETCVTACHDHLFNLTEDIL
jgi:hypothetical protein